MGLLTGEFTEQDEVLNQSKTTNAKTYKPSLAVDVGTSFIYGAEKGLFNLVNAGTRPFIGDEAADKGLANIDRQIKPTHQGTAGHVVSGVTEVLSAAAVTAPLGGAGVATSVGLSTRASEHSRLTQQFGVDQDTADTVSNMGGVAMAALTFVPMSNVFKSGLIDYAATVGGTTLAGQVLQYGQGAILENNGHAKVGGMYKDMATDPTMVLTNLGLGSAFWALGRMRTDPTKTQAEIEQAEAATYDAVDQAIADADRSSIPTQPETAGDMLQHEANLNQAIDQVMKGEKVNISEATGGQLKTLDDVKNYIQNKNTTNNKSINTAKNTSIKTPTPTFNIKAEVSKDQNVRVKDTYQAAQQAGFSPSQAKALTGELGRENDFNIDAMFGFHTDAANHKRNGGIFSWQGNRAIALEAHMRSRGLVNTNGTFKRTNESLTEQFAFLRKEIESNSKWKQSFLDKKTITNDEARAALGGKGTIIGWARGQSVLKSGKAFDWQSHEARANNYSNMVDGEPSHSTFDRVSEVAEVAPIRSESAYESTIQRTDLDTFPDLTTDFIGKADLDAFTARHTIAEDPFTDITTASSDHTSYLADDFGDLLKGYEEKIDPILVKELEKIVESFTTSTEKAKIPHTADGVQVKNSLNDPTKEFKPDPSIATEWKERQRFEDGKYHKELIRSFKDKEGNTVQEMKYRGSYVSRVVNDSHQTNSIHVGRSGKSDFVDHKGNKELETALDRIFEDRSFGYLSQIPKGQEAITKLKDNPNLVISSKKTGEDLTAQQWQQKLQREQDNIQMMAKAMSTLAKCALKQAA